ncbi:Protein HOT-4 b, partial [Aphelenchoides avenae]
HHYYPPKNFTDRCWHPDYTVGVTPCQSVCFTLVEEVYDYDLVGQAVMRGCMDRLLLFGMDVDIKDAITSRHYGCKTMDRHLIQLVPLHKEIPLVRPLEKKNLEIALTFGF